MSDLITKARNFLKEHLSAHGTTTVDEAHAVTAMVNFASSQTTTASPEPVTETTEYKQVKSQRDHNWNELQKAKTQIENLEKELAIANAGGTK